MMDEIQFIVAKLNDVPFRKNLTLVEFDEKSPNELLQLLVDVIGSMDDKIKGDVREMRREELVQKLLGFLNIIRYKLPDEPEREHFTKALEAGEKVVVYPVLFYILQKLPSVQKRAYLARFLFPVDIPQEFLQDETLFQLFQDHKALQGEFKGIHKQVDQLRAHPSKPAELKTEIATLEDERKQLQTKIERLKKQTDGEEGFKPLLEATSKLRQQQDKEAQLNENMRKQRMALQHVRQRQEDASNRLQALKRSQGMNSTAEDMMRQLQKEVAEQQQRVNSTLPRELEQQTARFAALQDQMFEPQRTKDDVEALRKEVEALDDRCSALRRQIDEAFSSRGDNKLTMFRQTSLAASNKLNEREEEMRAAERERDRIAAETDQVEARLSEVAGPKFMTRAEFKAYGNTLREKTGVYKRMKQELAALRAESVVLHRTEQILKGRDSNLEDFLQKLEAKRGVKGYRETQEKLEKAAENNRAIDETKESTLEEISELVRSITAQLKERKAVLAPQIKTLRDVRKVYQEVDSEYNRKKAMYDKVAVGLEVERQQIEAQCEAAQNECLQEESGYHYLNCLIAIAEADLERIENEVQWENGHGQLLPNFKTYTALFREKISRQKALQVQLQDRKKNIQENQGGNMKQRELFMDLRKLLAAKVQSKRNEGEVKAGFGASEFDMGAAKVMRLDES